MAIDFPNSPTVNDIYTVGDSNWKYDGEKWLSLGVTGPAGSAGAPANRNLIINGRFDIWQRGTSATITAIKSTSYLADRWSSERTAAGSTQGRVEADLSGFQYALRLQRDAGNTSNKNITTSTSLEQSIVKTAAGKTVTLSVYCRVGADFSNTLPGLGAAIVWASSADNNVLYDYSSMVDYMEQSTQFTGLTTSWQRFSLTATIPETANSLGIYFYYSPSGSITAGASDYFDITGVQLEVGTQATSFEQRPIGVELALCRRYFETSYNLGTAPGTVTTSGAYYVGCSNASALDSPVRFTVEKRILPTLRTYAPETSGAYNQVSEYTENPQTYITNRSVSTTAIGTNGYAIRSSGQFASGRFYAFHFYADSEL